MTVVDPNANSQAPRFSGYQVQPNGDVRLFVPGFYDPSGKIKYKVRAENLMGDSFKMVRDGDYWVTRDDDMFSIGGIYRLLVEYMDPQKRRRVTVPVVDNVETIREGDKVFNKISTLEESGPKRSGPIANIFLDRIDDCISLLTDCSDTEDSDSKVVRAISGLKKSGFSGIALGAFNAGDAEGSGRFVVDDPFTLNPQVGSKENLRNILISSMNEGTKFFAYGTYTNQGLEGVQYQSNLRHQFRSPYWDWFYFGDTRDQAGQLVYPDLARDKLSIGILPYHENVDFEQIDYRIINEPPEGKRAVKPLYIEFYNPMLEGNSVQKAIENPDRKLFKFCYRFPIRQSELNQKRKNLKELSQQKGRPVTDLERKQEFIEWSRFKLVSPNYDDSGEKWDNHISAVEMNLDNPDVVDYIKQGFVYWTRFARNTYVEHLAAELSHEIQGKPVDWAQLAEKLGYVPQGSTGYDLVAEFERVKNPEPLYDSPNNTRLARKMVRDFPVSSLNLPPHFKEMLTAPNFQKHLAREPMNYWLEQLMWVLQPILVPLRKFKSIDRFFGKLEKSRFFRPMSFRAKLRNKITEAEALLSEENQQKLRNRDVQNLLVHDLSEFMYLHILTGQSDAGEKAIASGLYKTTEEHVLISDPVLGIQPLIDFMKERLDQMPAELVAEKLREELNPVHEEAVSFADFLVKQLELGMNWRLDSVLDVMDLDEIREKPTIEEKNEAFLLAIEKTVLGKEGFWRGVTDSIYDVFSKSNIIANLDYDPTLCDWPTFLKATQMIANSQIFSTIATGANTKGSPISMVHSVPSPDYKGYFQSTPADYYHHVLEPMSRDLPFPIVRQYLNVLRTDINSTLPNNLLLNPAIADMDKLEDWGLLNYLDETVGELITKACFEHERQALEKRGVTDIPALLKRVVAKAQEFAERPPGDANAFSGDVWSYLSAENKQTTTTFGPTPLESKQEFIKELFRLLTVEDLKLVKPGETDEQTLRDAQAILVYTKRMVARRMKESGTARAMRAVIVNNVETLDDTQWQTILAPLKRGRSKLVQTVPEAELKEAFAQTLYQTLDFIIANRRSRFGKQPLEAALDMVIGSSKFDAFLRENLQVDSLPDLKKTKAAMEEVMYRSAMEVVLDKLLRVMAFEVAIPGNPTLDLPELFGQTGSTWLRSLVSETGRVHISPGTTMHNPMAEEFLQNVSQLLRMRGQYPVLSSGQMLTPEIGDKDTVLPIIRDDGTHQAIMLVNTGNPTKGRGTLGESATYNRFSSEVPVAQNYRLNLSSYQMSPGTAYVDATTGERFVVRNDHRLVQEADKNRGIDIETYRLLIRENTNS